jgi:hypothetical protein
VNPGIRIWRLGSPVRPHMAAARVRLSAASDLTRDTPAHAAGRAVGRADERIRAPCLLVSY